MDENMEIREEPKPEENGDNPGMQTKRRSKRIEEQKIESPLTRDQGSISMSDKQHISITGKVVASLCHSFMHCNEGSAVSTCDIKGKNPYWVGGLFSDDIILR